eukprot:11448820-Alexandrium_andersonii.AAC.1
MGGALLPGQGWEPQQAGGPTTDMRASAVAKTTQGRCCDGAGRGQRARPPRAARVDEEADPPLECLCGRKHREAVDPA